MNVNYVQLCFRVLVPLYQLCSDFLKYCFLKHKVNLSVTERKGHKSDTVSGTFGMDVDST